MLRLRDVHAHYGPSHILQGVSLHVEPGEVVALLGRNGVGKTTTIRTAMGLLRLSQGAVEFKDIPIGHEPPHRRARRGIGLVPQGRGIWPNLTVREHLLLPSTRKQSAKSWSLDELYDLFPRLREREQHSGAQLSGGEQEMLSIARALKPGPDLLLLDEPSDGLSPIMVQHIMEILHGLKQHAVSILLVEQNLHLALSVADRVYVMVKGRIEYEAPSTALAQDKDAQHRLLGV